jgi:hypothetical protein
MLSASPKISQNGTIVGFDLKFGSPSLTYYCPASNPGLTPLELRATNVTLSSVEIVTISLKSYSMTPMTALNVTLQLPSGSYDATFAGITRSTPLNFGQVANQTLTLPLDSMKTWTVYPMTESAILQDGQRPAWLVHVELEG